MAVELKGAPDQAHGGPRRRATARGPRRGEVRDLLGQPADVVGAPAASGPRRADVEGQAQVQPGRGAELVTERRAQLVGVDLRGDPATLVDLALEARVELAQLNLGHGRRRRLHGLVAGGHDVDPVARELQRLDRDVVAHRVERRPRELHGQAAVQPEAHPLGGQVGCEDDHVANGPHAGVAPHARPPVPEVEGGRHPAAQRHVAEGLLSGDDPRHPAAAVAQRHDRPPQLESLAAAERRLAERPVMTREPQLDREGVRGERLGAHSISKRS